MEVILELVDWRRLATPKLMASVAVLLVGLLVLGRTDLSAAEVPPGVPATSEQTAEIASLLRRQERAVFNSLTTGAMTDFPTIFYNDPTIPLGDGSKSAIAQVGTKAIDETMAELTPGPAGGQDRDVISSRSRRESNGNTNSLTCGLMGRFHRAH